MIWPVRHLSTLTFACILMAPNSALADDKPSATPSFSTPAVTEEFLRHLDNDQLHLLRQAIKTCRRVGKAMRSARNSCVTTTTDNEVAHVGNPDLVAFHDGLPATERYNRHRSPTVWHAWLSQH